MDEMKLVGLVHCNKVSEEDAKNIAEYYTEFLTLCNLLADDEELLYFFIDKGAIVFFKQKIPFQDLSIEITQRAN